MKYGIVDIGSNTIRLNIYRVNEDHSFSLMANNKYTAGLVNYIKKGVLTKSGINKLLYILGKIKNIAGFLELDRLYIFATASLRQLKNQSEVLNMVKDQLELEIRLLSGIEEARLGFEGVKEKYNIKDGLIIDIGGGSTEVSVLIDEVMKMTESFDMGSLSLQKNFVSDIMPNKKEIKEIQKKVRTTIYKSDLPMDLDLDTMYGIGGTIRACGNLVQDLYDRPNNKTVYYEDLVGLYKDLLDRKKRAIRHLLRINPSRTHTILPGLVILRELLEYSGIKTLKISQEGVREGYLKEVLIDGI